MLILGMKFFSLLAIIFSVHSHAIIGGFVPPMNDVLMKSTVAILSEYQGKMLVNCTGTVLSEYIVLTASHCVAEETGNKLFIGQGINPLKNPLFQVDKVKFVAKDFYTNENLGEHDIAILISSKKLIGMVPVKIGELSVSESSPLIQIGYGFNTKSDRYEAPSYGLLRRFNGAQFRELYNRQVIVNEIAGVQSQEGDSGGPLLMNENGKITIQGVLSSGSEMEISDTLYAHPYFYQNWINCSLPDELKLPVGELKEQFPCDSEPLLKVEDLPAYNEKLCRDYSTEWNHQGKCLPLPI